MSDTIIVLSDLDKIRQHPGMYIGDNDRLGLNTIVREVIDNAIDEYPNFPDKSLPIYITLKKDNIISVRDPGRGISPYQSNKIKGAIEERLAYTRIGAGGKFRENREKNGNRFSGGLHGTGATGANAMSTFFDVEIWKDGYYFHDHYENGIPVTELKNGNLPKKKLEIPETGTKVTFQASKQYMRTIKIDPSYLDIYLQQAAFLHPGLTLHFLNERDEEEEVTYYSENGLLDYIKTLATDENDVPISFLVEPFLVHGTAQAEVLGQTNRMEADIAVGFARGESFDAETFTNGIRNPAGGTHLQGFYQGLVDLLRHYYEEFQSSFQQTYKTQLELIRKVNNLTSTSEVFKLVKARNISKKTYVIIDFKHDDPILKPQTKDELASPEAKPAVAKIFYEKASLYLDKNIPAVQELIGFLIKDLYEKAKDESTSINLNKNEMKLAMSTKLASAKSKDPTIKEIFIVEGDSAGGGVKTNRDSVFQAVLALRGKVLNAKKALLSKLLANAEIATMIAAFGTGIGSKFDIKKLQYHKIIISTDQDIDGLHIQVLILTFILQYMPDLIRLGHVYILQTPLYVNVMKGKAVKDVYTYSEEEQVRFIKANGKSITDVQRNKGLGELTKEQIIDAMLTPKTRRLLRVTMNNEERMFDLLEQLMGTDVQGRRRLFVKGERHSEQVIETTKKQSNALIQDIEISTYFESSFYQYGMDVITNRALPDVRDGLKPVNRAIVYEMLRSKVTSDKKPIKVAKHTGAIIANWHPHGDSSVEDALTSMSEDWTNSLPAVHVKGNNGSIFGDKAAAGRYIEAKLTATGDAYGYKLKKGIVPYVPNFDNTADMPTVLPAQLPYLLINGISEGIAVGVAASLSPHNPREVLEMTLQYLKKPKTKTEDLLAIMPGPDFPSGATIINKDDLLTIYEKGEGKITVRATMHYSKKEHALHVTEIPFCFAGSMHNLVAELATATTETTNQQKKKIPPKISGVQEVNDYSGKDGIDICLDLAKGVNPETMMTTLYAKTRLETTVKFQFNALNDRQLHHYGLRQYLADYADFQHEIVTNEHTLEQDELNRRMEILVGRIIAASYIDEIVDAVKFSNGRAQVKDVLMHGTILPGTNKAYHKTVKTFQFTELQAESISEIPLYQLNKLDVERLQKEGQSIKERLVTVDRIVTDQNYRHKLIIKRLEAELKKLPDCPRKTAIISDALSKTTALEIPTIPLYLGMDKYGYLRIEETAFDGSIETTNKARVGFFDREGNCWNLFLDKTKTTKDRGTLLSQMLPTTNHIIGFTIGIQEDTNAQGLFLYEDGNAKRVALKRFWTKTRATKVSTRTEEHTVKAYYDIPADKNIASIDTIDYPLERISLQTASGNGVACLPVKEEPYTVDFKQGDIKTSAKAAKGVKSDVFDAVVTFTPDGQLLFDWTTLDSTGKDGLYVTTYQKLLTETLLFVHTDGTAKKVSGAQFAVKTKRTQIVANKEGVTILMIQSTIDETLVGTYQDGQQKRIATEKIPLQGKTGGGVRVFYTNRYTFERVESGAGSDLPIVTFATLPK